ncbi:glycerophosphodiester phosphodiesterase [Mesobacillus zeae]|uniref:Glycerophosphodiester phosphodiesterase n=1 Tax=Mesobacillus zeae TaxID=1917180 RepID=A0A398B533_9BACI|nr:glycerophosphodiester phosphodiesterase [Mesobacillus zeae]RID83928.1 glycerophosphodiester phosphodiesterase [Mesobacillus zeae]
MTLIFAHRGFAASFPENTMKSFTEAQKAGADGIELDVQMTKDGELVVIHDEKVDRTTDGKGYVREYTASDLRKLDARYKFQELHKKEQIPFLEEVLNWLKGNSMVCNIELKNGVFPYKGMEEKVISLIRRNRLENRIILSSFNHYSLVHAFRLSPEIEIAPLLTDGIYMPWIYAESIRAKGFHPHHRTLHDSIISLSLKHGIEVRPYTVNNEHAMERFIKLRTSAIITDDPAKGLAIRKACMQEN